MALLSQEYIILLLYLVCCLLFVFAPGTVMTYGLLFDKCLLFFCYFLGPNEKEDWAIEVTSLPQSCALMILFISSCCSVFNLGLRWCSLDVVDSNLSDLTL